MLPDDFAGFIAFEAPRAGIPARHHARLVQHIDGVVRDRFDKQTVAAIVGLRGRKTIFLHDHPLTANLQTPGAGESSLRKLAGSLARD